MVRDNIKFVGGGVTIYVATSAVKYNFTNGIKYIPLPNTAISPTDGLVINLNKVEKRWTITGFITNGKLNASETHTTALNKKNAFISMFGLGSVVVMTWESTDYNIAMDKYEVGYKSKDDKDDTSDGVIVYTVTLSGVEGTDAVNHEA